MSIGEAVYYVALALAVLVAVIATGAVIWRESRRFDAEMKKFDEVIKCLEGGGGIWRN